MDKIYIDKINEIEKRMNYVVDNWEFDPQISNQEIRFVLCAYIHGFYKNKKVKKLAESYSQKIKERRRLDSETILTALVSALIVGEDLLIYWNKLKNRIEKSPITEKSNLIIQLLPILNFNILKKIGELEYFKSLLEYLRTQGEELIYYWACKQIFLEKINVNIDTSKIKNLKEYLLWELITSEEYENQKESLREKFIPEILNYKFERFDLVVFLMYLFLKKNRIYIFTESELNRIIKKEVMLRINKKVWFPVLSSLLFLLIKLWSIESIKITYETHGQILMIIVGTSFLYFEERLPPIELPVKRIKITLGQIGEFMIVVPILKALGLVSLITRMIP